MRIGNVAYIDKATPSLQVRVAVRGLAEARRMVFDNITPSPTVVTGGDLPINNGLVHGTHAPWTDSSAERRVVLVVSPCTTPPRRYLRQRKLNAEGTIVMWPSKYELCAVRCVLGFSLAKISGDYIISCNFSVYHLLCCTAHKAKLKPQQRRPLSQVCHASVTWGLLVLLV